MANNNRKYKGSLELNWINKDKSLLYEIDEEKSLGVKPVWVEKDDIRVSEPRILKLKGEYGDPDNENMLIKGDNLLALRTLVEEFKNREEKDKVKCIYIDPPFNTGNAFEHYDDNLEHSQWLTMMRDRLALLRHLLREDGVLFLHLDDMEQAYARILLDEIFGRPNCIGTIIWKRRKSQANLARGISVIHDYIIVYCKDINRVRMNRMRPKQWGLGNFSNPDNDPRGPWSTGPCTNRGGNVYEITTPSGKKYTDEWRFTPETYAKLLKDNRIYFPNGGRGKPRYKIFLLEKEKAGVIPSSWWDDCGSTQDAKRHLEEIFKDRYIFDTPKPEELLRRILEISTKPGDLVLDSFLGSGTTITTAHKMRRRWIGIEIGNHADTICIPRINHVISGKDMGGISKIVNWKGGGGFRYYEVSESIIKELDMNWDMTLEEMSRAVFMNFDFSFVEGETYKIDGCEDDFHIGKQRGGIAICLVTKGTKIIKRRELTKLIKDLRKKHGDKKITIFTNMGVAVKQEELGDKLDVKKIPESILRKYRMV